MTGLAAFDALLQSTGGMGSVLGIPVRSLVNAAGLAVLALVLGGAIGLVHRWYAAQTVPEGLSVLVGLSGVALSLNTDFALAQVIDDKTAVLALETAVFNVSVFLAAGVAAAAGGRAGDRLGAGAFALTGADRVEGEVSKVVRAVGRVVTVDLPEDVSDIEGYDPVPPEAKAEFAGATLVFPRRLTVAELRKRLIERLKTDYGVGQVDVELDENGVVSYLAVGSRESGIGPSLPTGTAAIPVRADPAHAARAGDVVQVFRPADGDGAPKRVATAEVRGSAGDTVTLAVDEEETEAFDDTTRYRLVTLPTSPRADREFASLLRAAEETMGVATVADGSPLVGVSLGGLAVSVAAVRPAEGTVEAIPSRTRTLAAGDTLYAVARPALLRRLEAAARGDAGAAAPLADAPTADDDD
ncbi:TrkA C-terminal domain-containing protein [Haloglomus litoreum]|uniref:TrkA C-terminal domain-containing protein n=1 Tax=Haloglomus litoreum TaxID=3034026 RepID=UPI0023E77C34|nr:TrkA C-terminal domain-containing protein [Haloglomus sp. DT116]